MFAGLIAIAAVIVTNPYLFADWGTFINDLDRQRKFAGGPALLGQPERNGWWYYLTSAARGRSASCPACSRSRAGSRCWSKAAGARRSCSAR